jgi:hypothetical protein
MVKIKKLLANLHSSRVVGLVAGTQAHGGCHRQFKQTHNRQIGLAVSPLQNINGMDGHTHLSSYSILSG